MRVQPKCGSVQLLMRVEYVLSVLGLWTARQNQLWCVSGVFVHRKPYSTFRKSGRGPPGASGSASESQDSQRSNSKALLPYPRYHIRYQVAARAEGVVTADASRVSGTRFL